MFRPNPHFTPVLVALRAQNQQPGADRKKKKRKEEEKKPGILQKRRRSGTAITAKLKEGDEEEGKKKEERVCTHAHERVHKHPSHHHHLHSRFLKSSHISVTIATLLCLPLFFTPAFFNPCRPALPPPPPLPPLSLFLRHSSQNGDPHPAPRLRPCALFRLFAVGKSARAPLLLFICFVCEYQELPDTGFCGNVG